MNKITSITRSSLSRYYGAENIPSDSKVAVIDGTTCYGAGDTDEAALSEMRNSCREAGVELGEYCVAEIVD